MWERAGLPGRSFIFHLIFSPQPLPAPPLAEGEDAEQPRPRWVDRPCCCAPAILEALGWRRSLLVGEKTLVLSRNTPIR